MSRARWFTILGLLVAAPGAAQTQLGGFLEYDYILYFTSPDRQKINGRNQGILQLELRNQVGGTANMFGAVEVRNDQADPSRNRIFLDEAFVDLYFGDLDVRIGKQIYAWGRADAINPTDNLSVWDYSDILDTDDEKIGALSVRADYYVGDWTVEGVVVPSFTPSVLPETNSRWWPRLASDIPSPAYPGRANPTLAVTYAAVDAVLPDEGLESLQYAFKVSSLVRGWDFSVSWFDGYNDLPGIHTTTVVDPGFQSAEITFEPQYHRLRAIGADVATTIGEFGLRGEAAYFLTQDWDGTDPAVDDPYLQYAIGVDRTFRDVLPEKDLFVLLEWVQEVQVPDRKTILGINDLNHTFRKSLIGRGELLLGDFTKLTLEGVWNLYSRDWWLQPGLEWSVGDGIQIRGDLDLLDGPPDSFFGGFHDNRRLHLRLKYSY